MSQAQLLFSDPVEDQAQDVDAVTVLNVEVVCQWLKTATQAEISAVWSTADGLLPSLERKGGWR